MVIDILTVPTLPYHCTADNQQGPWDSTKQIGFAFAFKQHRSLGHC